MSPPDASLVAPLGAPPGATDTLVGLRLDEGQREICRHRGGPLLVLGESGSGKTTALIGAVQSRVASGDDPARILVLSPRADGATTLRDRLTGRHGRTTPGAMARSFHSIAHEVLRLDATLRALEPPKLLPAAEQATVIRDLLAGDREGRGVPWPRSLSEALGTQAFAQELADLAMLLNQQNSAPGELWALGERRADPEWRAAGAFVQQYRNVVSLRGGGRWFDQAELVTAAADLLEGDPLLRLEAQNRLDVVLVDEYEDVDPAQERLLGLLTAGDTDLVVFADPCLGVNSFRGARRDAVSDFARSYGIRGDGAPGVIRLTDQHRQSDAPAALARLTRPVSPGLGTPHGGSVSDACARTCCPEATGVRVVATEAEQVATAAAFLHGCHAGGHSWADMAVVIRGGAAMHSDLIRALDAADVPVRLGDPSVPLARRPGVRALLDLLEAVSAPHGPHDADRIVSLLVGPVGRLSPLAIPELTRHLARFPNSHGDPWQNEDMPWLPVAAQPAGQRVRAAVLAGRRVISTPGATAYRVLWEVWQQTHLGPQWERLSLGNGPERRRANRDLDDVLELFEQARRFDHATGQAGTTGFVDHVRSLRVPRLGEQRRDGEVVEVSTVHAAKGREWQAIVVFGVQEGAWPDLRRRGGGLLRHEEALAALRDEEELGVPLSHRIREEQQLLYLALSRAREHVLVTAVANDVDGTQPSRFVEALLRASGEDPSNAQGAGEVTDPSPPMSRGARALVAQLRRAAADPERPAHEREAAAWNLARLARAGVPGADPDAWYGLRALSDARPLVEPGSTVHVSPSSLAAVQECPLRWFLDSSVADREPGTSQAVGRMLHALAEAGATQRPDAETMAAAVAAAWDDVASQPGWVGRREKARAMRMAQTLADWLWSRPASSRVATEVPFEMQAGQAKVRGSVDRVEVDADGGAFIVDLKTGASVASKADAEQNCQLAAYQLAAQDGALAPAGVSHTRGAALVYVGSPNAKATERPQTTLGGDRLSEVRALVAEAAATMAGAVFPARVGRACDFCPVRSSCPLQDEGRQVTQ